jgi:hypothetical protein
MSSPLADMTPEAEVILDLLAQRERMAFILKTFYQAPISLSAIQPILDLAVELNPELHPVVMH